MSDETIPLYVIENTANGDVLRSYDGMTKETVDALLAEGGNPFDYVDKATYDSGIEASQPVALDGSLSQAGESGAVREPAPTLQQQIDALSARLSVLEAKR